MNPIPTINPESIRKDAPSLLPMMSTPRKPPTKRIFRPVEINSKSYSDLVISNFKQITKDLQKKFDTVFNFSGS